MVRRRLPGPELKPREYPAGALRYYAGPATPGKLPQGLLSDREERRAVAIVALRLGVPPKLLGALVGMSGSTLAALRPEGTEPSEAIARELRALQAPWRKRRRVAALVALAGLSIIAVCRVLGTDRAAVAGEMDRLRRSPP